MPQYIALKTCKGRYGPITKGVSYTFDVQYGRELEKNGVVRERSLQAAPQNAAIESAPAILGNEQSDTADLQDDGQDKQPSVSRRGRHSRAKTART